MDNLNKWTNDDDMLFINNLQKYLSRVSAESLFIYFYCYCCPALLISFKLFIDWRAWLWMCCHAQSNAGVHYSTHRRVAVGTHCLCHPIMRWQFWCDFDGWRIDDWYKYAVVVLNVEHNPEWCVIQYDGPNDVIKLFYCTKWRNPTYALILG